MSIETATLLGLVLTVIALVVALWQILLGARQSSKLKRIGDSLSTRYLGPFPDYLSQVVTLLGHARHEILIVSNIPIIGVFSKEEAWLAIKHIYERALWSTPRLKMRAVFANTASRLAFLNNQYRDAFDKWPVWREDPSNEAKLASLIERFGTNESVATLSTEQFIQLLELAATNAIEVTLKGAEIFEISHPIPLYMWIVDAKEAIFAIPASVPTFAAHAFWTEDARLIGALISMHEEYLTQARPNNGKRSSQS